MSPMVAFQGTPFTTNYAATKFYVQTLAQGLAVELKPEQLGVPILKSQRSKTIVLPGLLTKLLVYSLWTDPRWGKVKIMKKVMG